jgi:hypothetical protein
MEYIKNSPAWQEFQGKHKVKYLTKRHLDRETKRLLDRETKRLFNGNVNGNGNFFSTGTGKHEFTLIEHKITVNNIIYD